jgi:hypothetical protein
MGSLSSLYAMCGEPVDWGPVGEGGAVAMPLFLQGLNENVLASISKASSLGVRSCDHGGGGPR